MDYAAESLWWLTVSVVVVVVVVVVAHCTAGVIALSSCQSG